MTLFEQIRKYAGSTINEETQSIVNKEQNTKDAKKNNTQKNNNSKSHGPAFTIIIMIGVYLAIIIAVINFFNKKKKLF